MKKSNIIVLILFIILTLFIGSFHEAWTDEAQSWMIARDASFSEILWDISRYEGTFPLWFYTLKICMTFGLQYENVYMVSIALSVIGLLVFLFKVDAPKYVKVLLPFTYYVFFQYAIVARSYSYLLLAFSIWASLYKERKNKPIKYSLALLFISFISMHGMIISGALGLMFIIELIKGKNLKKTIPASLLLVLVWIFECIVLCPKMDLYMNVGLIHSFVSLAGSIIDTILIGRNIFEDIYLGIGVILFIVFLVQLFTLKKNDAVFSICALLAFMFLIRIAPHHLGTVVILMMFCIIINYDELKAKFKHFDKLFIAFLVLYISFSVITSYRDVRYNYTGAEEMATYIKENDIYGKEIYRFGYGPQAILPYFEGNLYANTPTVYEWKVTNKDFFDYINFDLKDIEKYKETPEYILLEYNQWYEKDKAIVKLIEDSGLYKRELLTEGKMHYKCTYTDTEDYVLYKRIK